MRGRSAHALPRPPVRRARAATAAALALVGAAGGGCGAEPPSGAHVFSSECTACHTLSGHESGHVLGGDLARRRMSVAEVESFVRVMPVRQRLSEDQIHAVSRYVAAAQARLAP